MSGKHRREDVEEVEPMRLDLTALLAPYVVTSLNPRPDEEDA